MRITSSGQVTIPADIREKAGLTPDTEVTFEVEGTAVRIVPAPVPTAKSRGDLIIERLRGSGEGTMTTDEIMALTRGE